MDEKETVENANPTEISLIDELKSKLEHEQERNRYLAADFDNFRRRVHEDCKRSIEIAQMDILRQLLSLADDFERAFAQVSHTPEIESYLAGFELTYKSLKKLLATFQVAEISQNTVFDPELHEAVVQVENTAQKSGEIVEVLQKGYVYKGGLLRPARVSVKL